MQVSKRNGVEPRAWLTEVLRRTVSVSTNDRD